ncbi:hypothetical protein GGR50DRAFT_695087 [Xylaria sp. CBS 124048]|nr:hypothetical protein GGR50DRAFT_695087 [Xylaria sp. CBS 124048]
MAFQCVYTPHPKGIEDEVSEGDADDELTNFTSDDPWVLYPPESTSTFTNDEGKPRSSPRPGRDDDVETIQRVARLSSPATPRPPAPSTSEGDTSRASDLRAWLPSALPSLNSVRPPDPVYERAVATPQPVWGRMPVLPEILFRPRPPPVLRPHILAMPFGHVLRRYNLFAKLVDDYQNWYSRFVFALWTREQVLLETAGLSPPELVAASKNRPAVPPDVLELPFADVLRAAPLMSHLIERYHRDLGRDYFAFFHDDPRGYVSDSDQSLRLACLDVEGDE